MFSKKNQLFPFLHFFIKDLVKTENCYDMKLIQCKVLILKQIIFLIQHFYKKFTYRLEI